MIRESSDFSNTSNDAELSDWEREDMSYARRMTLSKELVDSRLISLYKLKRAETRTIEEVKKEEMQEEIACQSSQSE